MSTLSSEKLCSCCQLLLCPCSCAARGSQAPSSRDFASFLPNARQPYSSFASFSLVACSPHLPSLDLRPCALAVYYPLFLSLILAFAGCVVLYPLLFACSPCYLSRLFFFLCVSSVCSFVILMCSFANIPPFNLAPAWRPSLFLIFLCFCLSICLSLPFLPPPSLSVVHTLITITHRDRDKLPSRDTNANT